MDKAFASLAMTTLQQALVPYGLELNPAKTVFWSPSGPSGLPAELQAHYFHPYLFLESTCEGEVMCKQLRDTWVATRLQA